MISTHQQRVPRFQSPVSAGQRVVSCLELPVMLLEASCFLTQSLLRGLKSSVARHQSPVGLFQLLPLSDELPADKIQPVPLLLQAVVVIQELLAARDGDPNA